MLVSLYETSLPDSVFSINGILKHVTAGLNSEFFFLLDWSAIKVKDPNQLFYLPIAGMGREECMLFPWPYIESNMQTSLSRFELGSPLITVTPRAPP